MMAIIGWILCTIIMVKASIAAFLILLNCSGTYNIGGAVNKPSTKMKAWLFFMAVLSGWYLIAITFPFTVALK